LPSRFQSVTTTATALPSALRRTSSTYDVCTRLPLSRIGVMTTSPGWTSFGSTLPRQVSAMPRWRLPVFNWM